MSLDVPASDRPTKRPRPAITQLGARRVLAAFVREQAFPGLYDEHGAGNLVDRVYPTLADKVAAIACIRAKRHGWGKGCCVMHAHASDEEMAS